ncbi:mitochondrial carrier protein MTM1-like isoform X1 [Chenopodium quinoa]|uniref:mitochondrial carrier protein MTM1-like isoform X1 n=1 Tax=Chenopodium quinoa TaxID=63459 RepID=UPI000B7977F8|nr:mitochondrial carrier protein MTM1-like isoform X1 [Chenopodium quinoa]
MGGARNTLPTRLGAVAATNRVEFDENVDKSMLGLGNDEDSRIKTLADFNLGFGERAISAASAAVISALIVNPLDVAKTRLQAQAAGVPYQNQCDPACSETNTMLQNPRSSQPHHDITRADGSTCARECSQYKGTYDVFFKVTRQEGFSRLWRGTNASLALAIPTVGIYLPCYDMLRNFLEELTEQYASSLSPYSPLVAGSAARTLACITCYPIELARTRMQAFTDPRAGVKPPGVWKTLIGAVSPARSANHLQNLKNYRVLWTGLGAQLARDVPFSAICWGALEPIRRRILSLTGDEMNATSVLGANFAGGFVAGALAAAATCPLDVARTRRQIEKDPARQRRMTTRRTLMEIWRDGGWKGLFTGISLRVARAGPSVGIVVSSYELMKYALYRRHLNGE